MTDTATPLSADPAVIQAVADANARFDGTASEDGTAPVVASAKPDYVPDEFWNAETNTVDAEALARSYSELKAKGAAPVDAPADAPAEAPADDAAASPVAKALSDAGMDFDAINAEYQADGDIKPETRAKLVAAFGAPMVDNYFAGLKSQESQAAADYSKTITDAVGGSEKYAEMGAWAMDNIPASDLATYNQVVNGGDADAAALAAKGLYARFSASGGIAPALFSGKTVTSASAGYASIQAMTNDMKDARYGKDSAFRQEVDRKISASTGLVG